MEPVLLTSREAAAALRCGERTLRRLVASGGLPYVQVGGRRRYRPGDIAEFVESRRPGGA